MGLKTFSNKLSLVGILSLLHLLLIGANLNRISLPLTGGNKILLDISTKNICYLSLVLHRTNLPTISIQVPFQDCDLKHLLMPLGE